MSLASSRTKHTRPISILSDNLLLVFQAIVDDMYCDDDERLDCFILTSVCRRWRLLVLSTPRFWRRLHMVVKPRALSSARLETCVKRSANALVDVVIYLPYLPNSRGIRVKKPSNLPRTEACLKVLQDCSHRWRSLRVIVIRQESDYIMTDIFNLVLSRLSLSHAPALYDVEILCPTSLTWVTSVENPFQLLSSPSLRKLKLHGCDSKILPRPFDASSLTHLSLNFFREYDDVQNSHVAFHNLLLSAQNLTSLEVHQRVFLMEHAETSGELEPVALHILRTLSISMGTEMPAYLSGILRTINAPNLLHFSLYSDSLVRKENSLLDFSSPAFFLSRDQTPKFPLVRKLTMKNVLQSVHGPGKNIHSIFTAFRHVEDVVLDQDVREIVDYLALESYDQNAPPPWPCLRRLTIEMPSMTKFHYIQQLLEWLRLRRTSRLLQPMVVIRYQLQGCGANDARDLTKTRKIVNDATGYCAPDTKVVVKQLRQLGALVDLRIIDEWFPC